MKTVVLWSPANLGDLHISRSFVRDVIKHGDAERFRYLHRHPRRILQDIDGLEQLVDQGAINRLDNHTPCIVDGDTVYLSTWYACSPVWHRGQGFGCTLNTIYELFSMHARQYLGYEIKEPVERFIPQIDFSRFVVDAARSFFTSAEGIFRRKVMISNGEPQSGQTSMEPGVFRRLVAGLVSQYPDVMFLLTNRDPHATIAAPNVFYTRDIIGLPDEICDLPENGYVSTRCDVLIGRGSGAYSFAYLADNFLDKNRIMICFTDDERTARWIYPTDAVRAHILWSNDYRLEAMRAVVEDVLR